MLKDILKALIVGGTIGGLTVLALRIIVAQAWERQMKARGLWVETRPVA